MKNNLLRPSLGILLGLIVLTIHPARAAHAADQGVPMADFEPLPKSATGAGVPSSSDPGMRDATQDELGLGIRVPSGQAMPDATGAPEFSFGGDALDNEYHPNQKAHPVFSHF